jgi:hypothetical protein
VIGPSFSSQTTVTGILATYLQIPLLSPSATAKSLSDKSIYEYFIRNVPPDDRQAVVNAELIQHFNWKDVAVLATTEAYSVGLAEEFIAIAKSYDISIRNVGFFPTTVSKKEIKNLLNILQSTGVRIIVLYMFSPQWIVSHSLSCYSCCASMLLFSSASSSLPSFILTFSTLHSDCNGSCFRVGLDWLSLCVYRSRWSFDFHTLHQ